MACDGSSLCVETQLGDRGHGAISTLCASSRPEWSVIHPTMPHTKHSRSHSLIFPVPSKLFDDFDIPRIPPDHVSLNTVRKLFLSSVFHAL